MIVCYCNFVARQASLCLIYCFYFSSAGSLAIGITLNLVYHGTKEEAAIAEVSGLAYHFKPQFFDELYQRSGVRLENFVYYKNETHYFVMTAVKSSLLARGVLLMVSCLLLAEQSVCMPVCQLVVKLTKNSGHVKYI